MVKNKALSKVVNSKREVEWRRNEELSQRLQQKHDDFIRERKLNTSVANRDILGGDMLGKIISLYTGFDLMQGNVSLVGKKIQILNSYITGMFVRTERAEKYISIVMENNEYVDNWKDKGVKFDIDAIVCQLHDNADFFAEDIKHLLLLTNKLPNLFHYLNYHYLDMNRFDNKHYTSGERQIKLLPLDKYEEVMLKEVKEVLTDFLQLRLNYKKELMKESDIILLDYGLFDSPRLSVEERRILIELMDLKLGDNFIKRATVMSYSIVGFWENTAEEYKTIKL